MQPDQSRLNEATHIVWIPVKQLSVIWVGAQRPYDPKWAEKIAANFDPEQFDPIKVTLPNGHGIFHVVEGQHRVSAIVIRFGSEEKCPCIVLEAGDPERAAKLWLESNRNKKAAKPLDAFIVALTANETTEVEINKIVNSCGYHVGAVGPNSKNAIQAVQALKTIYRRHGAITLKTTINQISATWGKDPNAMSGPIMSGYGQFFGQFPPNEVNLTRLIKVIQSRYAPGQLLAAARSKQDTNGKQMPACIRDVLVDRYNYGAKPSQKLHPK